MAELDNYTAEVQVGGLSATSPKLKPHDRGMINLIFLRAGLFSNNKKSSGYFHFKDNLNHPVKNRLRKMPVIPNFSNQETVLNPGYLYIIDDKFPDKVFYEYKVLDNGILCSIKWSGLNLHSDNSPKDFRAPLANDRIFQRNISLPKDTEIWVAYSPVQWSYKYFKKHVDDPNIRGSRMKKVKCSGFVKSSYSAPGEDLLCYLDCLPAFNIETTVDNLKRELEDVNILLHHDLEIIHKAETQENTLGNNDLYEDMFVVLDDPLGCVSDIAYHLKKEHVCLDAILESIQTGANETELFNQKIGKSESNTSQVLYENDASYLSALAITIKSMLYGVYDLEAINSKGEIKHTLPDKYRKAADKEKLDKVLGVDERTIIKDNITSLRYSLEELLKTDYCHKSFKEFLDNGNNETIFFADAFLKSVLGLLSIFPHDKDRHLTLSQNIKKDDMRIDFLKSVYDDNTYEYYYKILNEPLNIDSIVDGYIDGDLVFVKDMESLFGFDFAYIFATSINDLLGTIVKFKYSDFKMGKFSRYLYRKQEVIQFDKMEFDRYIKEELRLKTKPILDEVKNKRGVAAKSRYRLGLDEEQIKIIKNKNVFRFNNGQFVKLSKFLELPAFKGSLAGLEMVNLIIKISSPDKKGKDWLSMIGSSVLLTHFSMEWTMSVRPTLKTLRLTSFAKGLGYAGAGINVIVSGLDAYDFFAAGDNDAAALSVVSGALSGAFMIMLVAGCSAPPLVIVAALAFIVGILVMIFADDQLETYLRNNIIGSNSKSINYSSLRPYEYIGYLCDTDNREKIIVNDKFAKLRDFELSYNYLSDFFQTFERPQLFFYDNKFVKKGFWAESGYPDYYPFYKKIYIPHNFAIRVKVNLFTPDNSAFDFSLYLKYLRLNPGMSKETLKEIERCLPALTVIEQSEVVDGVRHIVAKEGFFIDIFYTITDAQIEQCFDNNDVELEFQARLIQNINAATEIERRCWPSEYLGDERYMSYRFDAYRMSTRNEYFDLNCIESKFTREISISK